MFFMTPNVLRNVTRKSSTRLYPFVERAPFENARGELYCEIEKCIFCKTCERKCPSQCITVDNKAAKWIYDPMACVFCGVCVEACPVTCLHQKLKYRTPTVARESVSMQGELKKPAKKAKAE